MKQIKVSPKQNKTSQNKVKQTNTRKDSPNQGKVSKNKVRRVTTLALESHAPSSIVTDSEELGLSFTGCPH